MKLKGYETQQDSPRFLANFGVGRPGVRLIPPCSAPMPGSGGPKAREGGEGYIYIYTCKENAMLCDVM